jgi:hypothetical protein
MVQMLKKGDEVITIGGLFGTVTGIGDDWVELEVAKRTRVRFLKRSISQIISVEEEEEDEDDEYIEAGDDDVVEEDEAVDEAEEDEAVDEAEEDEAVDEADQAAPEAPPAPKPPEV